MGEQQKNVQEQDVNQLRKVRREKLANLQAEGKDPFQITKCDVTAHAADVKDNFEGAMSIMESKKDDLVDFYDRKKFSHDIKKQMKNEMK